MLIPDIYQWFGLVFSMSLLAASLAMGATLAISYCIDSYKDISGEAMVTIMLIRNTMSFAIGYGYALVFSLHLGIFCIFFFLSFLLFGPFYLVTLQLITFVLQCNPLGDKHGLPKRIHNMRLCGSCADVTLFSPN